MKNDSSRTEFIAIPVVLVVLGVLFGLMLAADIGPWALVVFVTALVVLALGVIAAVVRRRRHPPAFDAPSTARGRRPPRTTASACSSSPTTVSPRRRSRRRSRRVPPVGPSRRSSSHRRCAPGLPTGRATTRSAATRRRISPRRWTVSRARGSLARGEVGADDPIQAADDALRTFEADEVVFVTGGDDANWLERGVVDLARERYDIPVTHVAGGAPDS